MALIDGSYYYKPPAKKTYYTRPPNSASTQRKPEPAKPVKKWQPIQVPTPAIYEDDAVNYGLPGWTMPGNSPTGNPPPGTRPYYSGTAPVAPKPIAKKTVQPYKVYPQFYEEQSANFGLPGWTVQGMSPTGAPPPGTREYYAGTSPVRGKQVAPPLTDWRYWQQGFPKAQQQPTNIVPGTPSFDAWRKAYPMARLPDPANLASQPAPTWQTQPFVPRNTTRVPNTPATRRPTPSVTSPWLSSRNAMIAPTSFTEANATPGIYRPRITTQDWVKWFTNQPRMTMEQLLASGADPWAHDPYDPAGSPYMTSTLEPITEGGGGGGYGWGGGGGYSDKHYNSNPNYVSGQRGYAQAHRQNMLVWNI